MNMPSEKQKRLPLPFHHVGQANDSLVARLCRHSRELLHNHLARPLVVVAHDVEAFRHVD